MIPSEIPPTDPRAGDIARAKMALTIALIAIAISTIVALVFLRHYPLALRLFIVAGDLIVMATLWLVARQKFSGK
ncbi:MAG: hypothetical protein ABI222_14095 [Opitutaceae bacterium]